MVSFWINILLILHFRLDYQNDYSDSYTAGQFYDETIYDINKELKTLKLLEEKDLWPSPSLLSLFIPKAVQQNRSTTHDHVSIAESNMTSDSLEEIDHVEASKLEAKNIISITAFLEHGQLLNFR